MEIVGIHILWPVGLFYGHLVYFGFAWYIFPHFGMLYKETSGKTAGLGGEFSPFGPFVNLGCSI
jgi:hypothetical protein